MTLKGVLRHALNNWCAITGSNLWVCSASGETITLRLTQHQWLLTSWVRTPFALFQLLVFLPQEPFVHQD